MAELKTKSNNDSVTDFLNKIEDEQKRKDSFKLLKMMQTISGTKPKMWGTSIIGFGNVHYKYDSGHEGDWFITGFSPRKQSLTLYAIGSFKPHTDLLEKLGKYSTGVGCLYIKKLRDVDTKVLNELIERCFQAATGSYR
jgi:hypothetical protein